LVNRPISGAALSMKQLVIFLPHGQLDLPVEALMH
jgi:hypothetical protein